jgi:ubiquinone/menaquinone biosynthesis C-methylase UbiE
VTDDVNRRVYETVYSPGQLTPATDLAYDRQMVDLRNGLVRRYGDGAVGADLCCGTGSYLLPNLDVLGGSVAIDFTEGMLRSLMAKASAAGAVLADVCELPVASESVDIAFSFASLYYVPDLERALSEAYRILRPGGTAVFELGNRNSLSRIVDMANFRAGVSAQPHYLSYPTLRGLVASVGFRVVEWRSFQILPMYGAPRRLRWLAPLLMTRWKRPMGVQWRGRMVDEWVSSAPGLRHLAFRHLVVARRR